jgi:hypothetical protein
MKNENITSKKSILQDMHLLTNNIFNIELYNPIKTNYNKKRLSLHRSYDFFDNSPVEFPVINTEEHNNNKNKKEGTSIALNIEAFNKNKILIENKTKIKDDISIMKFMHKKDNNRNLLPPKIPKKENLIIPLIIKTDVNISTMNMNIKKRPVSCSNIYTTSTKIENQYLKEINSPHLKNYNHNRDKFLEILKKQNINDKIYIQQVLKKNKEKEEKLSEFINNKIKEKEEKDKFQYNSLQLEKRQMNVQNLKYLQKQINENKIKEDILKNEKLNIGYEMNNQVDNLDLVKQKIIYKERLIKQKYREFLNLQY